MVKHLWVNKSCTHGLHMQTWRLLFWVVVFSKSPLPETKGKLLFLCHQNPHIKLGSMALIGFLFIYFSPFWQWVEALWVWFHPSLCLHEGRGTSQYLFNFCPSHSCFTERNFYCRQTCMCVCVSVGQWGRSAEEDQPEVTWLNWRKCYRQVGIDL